MDKIFISITPFPNAMIYSTNLQESCFVRCRLCHLPVALSSLRAAPKVHTVPAGDMMTLHLKAPSRNPFPAAEAQATKNSAAYSRHIPQTSIG